jgi:hypothetical protein
MQFTKVWYRADARNWGIRRAYQDIGTLDIENGSLTFKGEKESVSIGNIRSVTKKRVGRDFINKWTYVQYEAGGEPREAYFVDGGALGLAGILGGNTKLFDAITAQGGLQKNAGTT